jgi:hypothetical protein
MDYAAVLQIAVAIAMLCVLLVALWPKLSCQLSDSEHENLPSSRPSVSANMRAESGRYAERVRHTYQRLFSQESSPARASGGTIEPTEQEEGPTDGNKAA